MIDDTFERDDGEKDHMLVVRFSDNQGERKLFEGVIMEKNGIAGVYQVKMLSE